MNLFVVKKFAICFKIARISIPCMFMPVHKICCAVSPLYSYLLLARVGDWLWALYGDGDLLLRVLSWYAEETSGRDLLCSKASNIRSKASSSYSIVIYCNRRGGGTLYATFWGTKLIHQGSADSKQLLQNQSCTKWSESCFLIMFVKGSQFHVKN